MQDLKINYDKKTADLVMKSGADFSKDSALAALKKRGGYGIASFEEMKPEARKLVLGISGMT